MEGNKELVAWKIEVASDGKGSAVDKYKGYL